MLTTRGDATERATSASIVVLGAYTFVGGEATLPIGFEQAASVRGPAGYFFRPTLLITSINNFDWKQRRMELSLLLGKMRNSILCGRDVYRPITRSFARSLEIYSHAVDR